MRQFRFYDMGKSNPTGLFSNPRLVAEIHAGTLFCALVGFCSGLGWDVREVDLIEDTVLLRHGIRYECREIKNGMEVVSLVAR